MTRPIRVGVLDAEEARDLIGALAVRGLVGRPLDEGHGVWVELHEGREDADRLLSEAMDTISAWVSDRGKDSVDVHGDRVVYTVRLRPEDLGAALGTRLTEIVERRRSRP
ncbi:MAG: hypothetical protein L0206_15085 [Actinobacteria bacterium]|nr:hypothetical protein [Actinomycetota bacterium]